MWDYKSKVAPSLSAQTTENVVHYSGEVKLLSKFEVKLENTLKPCIYHDMETFLLCFSLLHRGFRPIKKLLLGIIWNRLM